MTYRPVLVVLVLVATTLIGCNQNSPETVAPAPVSQEAKQLSSATQNLPRLVSFEVKNEGKEGDVYILPNPTEVRATVEGTDKVFWRVLNSNQDELYRLLPKEGKSGEWSVKWGNPNPPPPVGVYLVLMAKVFVEIPDSSSFLKSGNDRYVELVRVRVKGF